MPNEIIPLLTQLPAHLRAEYEVFIETSDSGIRYEPTRAFADAAEWAARLEADMKTTLDNLQIVHAWLRRLYGVFPGERNVDAIIDGVVMICADVPLDVWNMRSLTDALSRFRFAPVPSELRDFLENHALRAKRPIRVLRAIAAASARAVSAAPYDPGPAVSRDAARSVVQMAASGFKADETDRPGTRSGAAIRPPVRSVEEQIAILRGERPMPAVEIFGDAG